MTAYYNEHDPKAAAWIRELIRAGHIGPGHVDERSIEDVRPADLAGYRQCHFFAGIGVWSYALRRAGWPDDRAVWTGSCPCQPFSAAGKGAGFDDERHLWPAWFQLIAQCRPGRVYGEQVASKDGLAWLDLVLADLEAADYAVRAVDLCAAGVGAPHIRQRLWFVADADGGDARAERQQRSGEQRLVASDGGAGHRGPVVDPLGTGLALGIGLPGVPGGLADDNDAGQRGLAGLRLRGQHFHDADGRGPVRGFWSDAEWVACRDNKFRPVEPGTFPLAHGAAARVGRLRGYGNAIVAPCAQAFIEATL